MKNIGICFFLSTLFLVILSGTSYGNLDYSALLKQQRVIFPAGSFKSGETDIRDQYINELNSLAEFLKENRGVYIEIGGHTDNVGSEQFNQKLSYQRAEMVKNYLITKGEISAARITTKGYGSRYPIADNKTAAGRAQNRRIEIVATNIMGPLGNITFIRRIVLTRLFGYSDFIDAFLGQGLFDLDRTLTREDSNATVNFQDGSKINLAPQSLLVVHAKTDMTQVAEPHPSVELKTGGLRTKLKKMKGEFKITTPSCSIDSNSVEIQVGIDEAATSAVSVYDGSSKVGASGTTVKVPMGYGTVVKMRQAPSPPVPLPPAPHILGPTESEQMLDKGTRSRMVNFEWIGTEKMYHFQIAEDSEYTRIIQDKVVSSTNLKRKFPVGTYFWRVSGLTISKMEGFPAKGSFTIVDYKEPLDLPLTLNVPAAKQRKLIEDTYKISGKTEPGTVIQIGDKSVSAGPDGQFESIIELKRGNNDITVKAEKPGFKPKTVNFRINYVDLWGHANYFVYRYLYFTQGHGQRNIGEFQVSRIFPAGPNLEFELGGGLTKSSWDEYPGEYVKNISAIPITGDIHLSPGKKLSTPYLSLGLSAYLAFAEKRNEKKFDTELFISPEIGLGIAFPTMNLPAKFELKYTYFPVKEPFYSEMVQGVIFNFKVKL